MKCYTIWFTGLSGSGKTTIANELVKRLRKRNIPVVLLDGDIVRKTLSRDLGYTKEDRDKHITRVADNCHLINENGISCLACVISPTRKIRKYARDLTNNFIEVYIKCNLDVCEKRDVKGYYKQARDGEIKDFVGINIPYEAPQAPEITIETDTETLSESVNKLLKYLEEPLMDNNMIKGAKLYGE